MDRSKNMNKRNEKRMKFDISYEDFSLHFERTLADVANEHGCEVRNFIFI